MKTNLLGIADDELNVVKADKGTVVWLLSFLESSLKDILLQIQEAGRSYLSKFFLASAENKGDKS